MSDQTPTGEPTTGSLPQQPYEHTDAGHRARPTGRRTAGIAVITAGTLAVVGAGAFAAVQFLGAGPQAEQAIPAGALAVVSLDLDPGAKQKVEALKTLRKFPELKRQLKLGSGDDLRQKFFDAAFKDEGCSDLTYTADVKPWIGDSVALAAVSFTQGKASPVVSLAVKDQDKAARAIRAIQDCSKGGDASGFAFDGDFVVVSDSQAHADRAVEQAKAKPLTDDAGYQKWSDKVGDRGVVNFYVAKAAADYIVDAVGHLGPGLVTQSSSGASAPYASPVRQDQTDALRKALAKFSGAAGALRFADGGAELELVSGGVDQSLLAGRSTAGLVSGLPSDTTAVLGLAVPKGWAEKVGANLDGLGLPGLGGQDFSAQLESRLGISLSDLETLLGSGLAVSLSGTPADDLASLKGPQDLPAGLTIQGDPTRIKAVITRIEQKLGTTLADNGVSVVDGNGRVTLAFDADYAASLRGTGGLGDKDAFRTVVPEADKSSVVLFVDFNSRWREAIAKAMAGSDGTAAQQFLENTQPLEAFGLSSWADGDTSHVLLKVTTD